MPSWVESHPANQVDATGFVANLFKLHSFHNVLQFNSALFEVLCQPGEGLVFVAQSVTDRSQMLAGDFTPVISLSNSFKIAGASARRPDIA
jgi:hypothetical protein